MSRSHWQQTRALFDQCLDLDSGARAEVLAAVTEELRSDVAELLRLADGEVVTSGRYQPISILDPGGRGLVFRARDDASAAAVVLKMFRVQASRLAEATRLLERQVEITTSLPHTVRWLATGVGEHRVAWVVMAPSEALPLAHFLAEAQPTQARRIELFRQIQQAVEAASAQGLPGRWPEPGQVLVDARDAVWLTDVGLVAEFAVVPGPPSQQDASPLAACVVQMFPGYALLPGDAAGEVLRDLSR